MICLRRILKISSCGLAALLAQPVAAATNGAVLPLVKVPAAGIELPAAGFLPTNRLSGQAVRVLSSEGPFDMQLLPAAAPNTVTNFLRYVDAGLYRNLLVHRSIPGRLIQSGAVTLDGYSLHEVPLFPPVTNEFQLSNLRGTVAMAKLAGSPDSATSDWFVNAADNTELDTNNGGFTVFARVLGAGMSNVDRIAALPVYDKTNFFPTFGDLFAEMPLKNHNTNAGLFISNLVVITNVVKLPAATSSTRSLGGVDQQQQGAGQVPRVPEQRGHGCSPVLRQLDQPVDGFLSGVGSLEVIHRAAQSHEPRIPRAGHAHGRANRDVHRQPGQPHRNGTGQHESALPEIPAHQPEHRRALPGPRRVRHLLVWARGCILLRHRLQERTRPPVSPTRCAAP